MFKTFLALVVLLGYSSIQAWECPKGKIDIGAALIDIDVLESGKTVETLHLRGVKTDATILVYQGWFIKPNFIWAEGDGRLATGGIAVGHCFPVHDKLTLLPSVGYGFSYLRNEIDIPTPLGEREFTRKFHSDSPFISLEFTFKMTEKWILMGYAQYIWSRTITTVKPNFSGSLVPNFSDKSHSAGPNYGLGIEYCVTPKWSLTAGVGYNISLSHEKHGLRAKGAKLGMAYYF